VWVGEALCRWVRLAGKGVAWRPKGCPRGVTLSSASPSPSEKIVTGLSAKKATFARPLSFFLPLALVASSVRDAWSWVDDVVGGSTPELSAGFGLDGPGFAAPLSLLVRRLFFGLFAAASDSDEVVVTASGSPFLLGKGAFSAWTVSVALLSAIPTCLLACSYLRPSGLWVPS
jgi:hypothetical protein